MTEFFHSVKHKVVQSAFDVREKLAPVRKTSGLIEGVLTPEEFVAAGDQLVAACPTWAWAAGDPSRARRYLPPDKQYLVTRNVPCRCRVAVFEAQAASLSVDGGGADGGMMASDLGDDWLAPEMLGDAKPPARDGAGSAGGGDEEDEYADIASLSLADGGSAPPPPSAAVPPAAAPAIDVASGIDDDEYCDLADFEEDNIVGGDTATLAPGAVAAGAGAAADDNIVRTRTYDVSISYDKYYQTPRLWLFGYDEGLAPLSPEAVYEDIVADYRNRTVTIDPHPHVGTPHASIHPCRHAAVMKRIVENLTDGGAAPMALEQYLFIFLKFIQSVVPTIDYDFTLSVRANTSARR